MSVSIFLLGRVLFTCPEVHLPLINLPARFSKKKRRKGKETSLSGERTVRRDTCYRNGFRWVRRETVNRAVPLVESLSQFSSLPLPSSADNKSKSRLRITVFPLSFSVRSSKRRLEAWGRQDDNGEGNTAKEGVKGSSISALHLDGAVLMRTAKLRGDYAAWSSGWFHRRIPTISNEPRHVLSSLSTTTDPATSASSTPRGRTITW
jgi:hypothetical protein